LEQAFAINPRDSEALSLGAEFFSRQHDPKAAAALLAHLVQLQPADGALWAQLGSAQFEAGQLADAEQALERARELASQSAVVAELLGRIRLKRGDSRAALHFFDESLAVNRGNQPLWFLRADICLRLGDWLGGAESMERGIELGGGHLERRTQLIRLYLEHQQNRAALKHVQQALAELPAEAETRATYAGFLEKLGRTDEAVTLWQNTLEAAPKFELGYYSLARLLLAHGDKEGALRVAEGGIKAAPASARLQLVRVSALEALGDVTRARDALRKAAASFDDVGLISKSAESEDCYGRDAAGAYVRLATALQKVSVAGPERVQALKRGLKVALRDGKTKEAEWFGLQLRALGHNELLASGLTPAPDAGRIWIRGGLDALSFIAHGRPKPDPRQFLGDYCRAVVQHTRAANKKEAASYIEGVRDYFTRLSSLVKAGLPAGGKIQVTLSLADKTSRRESERILGLLGWNVKYSGNKPQLLPAEKLSQARAHETTSALAIDEVGMQKALEASKPFQFEIRFEWASVALGEKIWREEFYPKENLPGGLPEALVRDPRLAQTYLALSSVDEQTAAALLSGVGLRSLAEKYCDLLYRYASSLATGTNGIILPGGSRAAPFWTKLTGTAPHNPRFLKALLDKDDGRSLAFFSTLLQLDAPHQSFFTQSAARLARFYELFRESPDFDRGGDAHIREGSFAQFLREVPLDDGGHVDFPGSPEVWMVAKGGASSLAKTAKMIRKLKKVVAPDVEDEILLRLARTRYKNRQLNRSELDNFLAVVRIDRHRKEPMDEASALMLAQHYAEYEPVYPYFATLTGLQQVDFAQFFAFGEALRTYAPGMLNSALGQWHSLVELLCLGQQANALPSDKAAQLFRGVTERFAKAADRSDLTRASLDALRQILAAAGAEPGADADQAIRDLLLGSVPTSSFELNNRVFTVDAGTMRRTAYQKVIQMQKVTPLGPLLRIYDAALALRSGKASTQHVQIIDENRNKLLTVEIPKVFRVKGSLKDDLEAFHPGRLAQVVAKAGQKFTKKKRVDPKDLEKLSKDILAEINPQVNWALSGLIYARFLSSDDLLVADDALLLRKHRFSTRGLEGGELFPFSALRPLSEGAGSFFIGGFADFPLAVGQAAVMGSKQVPHNAEDLFSAQMAALRASDHRSLTDGDLRRFGLLVRTAREWIVESAISPELRDELERSTLGLLSPARRRDLLSGIAARQWPLAWSAATLNDLYHLGRRYVESHQKDAWQSPALSRLRQELKTGDLERLQTLGAVQTALTSCTHPHLAEQAPYEEFERYLMPDRIAQRVAEFKLYLADWMNAVGIPAAAFGALAEPVARQVYSRLHVDDLRDWRSALIAFSKIGDDVVEVVLAKQ
jgi:tetratricopeptide (TPR) repeat protein